jgi:hypothetical protein
MLDLDKRQETKQRGERSAEPLATVCEAADQRRFRGACRRLTLLVYSSHAPCGLLIHHTDEQILRAHITKLQEYRRLGLRTQGDIDAYQIDLIKRVCIPLAYHVLRD